MNLTCNLTYKWDDGYNGKEITIHTETSDLLTALNYIREELSTFTGSDPERLRDQINNLICEKARVEKELELKKKELSQLYTIFENNRDFLEKNNIDIGDFKIPF